MAPGGGGGEAPPAAVPHLDDGVVSDILHRLPTKDAYRVTAVCPRWREIVSGPAFLSQHLSPRPLPLLDDRPDALILQPRKIGYTHLTVVPADPAGSLDLNLPLDPKYTSKSEASRRRYSIKHPTPVLFDNAADNFILRGLYSIAAVDEVRDGNALVDPDQATGGDAVSVDVQAAEADVPLPVEEEDHVVFFERTVPMLDISFVASHGRLLLGRSRSRGRYYVCDPADNRWLALPPPPILPTQDTASGLHYDVDAATGRVSFTVVLLVRARRRRLRVETFSSATGEWATTNVPGAQGAARRFGVGSPGIRVGTCFYWLCRRPGHVVRYDVARGRASVVRDPPETESSKGRAWRSLGSAGGRLRLCAFDLRDEESSNMLPHDGVEGVHCVWAMDEGAAWRRVHEAVVGDMSTYYFNMLWGMEMALDFAGASTDSILVDKEKYLLRYDLASGDKVELASLYLDDGELGALYGRFCVFPFYRSG